MQTRLPITILKFKKWLMVNINIFNANVEVGTLTKISESSSEETPSAFDHKPTLSRLSCPDASIMIFGTTETRKHHLIGP
jgi:hypothetical protein